MKVEMTDKSVTMRTTPGGDRFETYGHFVGASRHQESRSARLRQSTSSGIFSYIGVQLWNTAIGCVSANWCRLKTLARSKDARPADTRKVYSLVTEGTDLANQENRQPTKCNQRRPLTNCPFDSSVLGQPQIRPNSHKTLREDTESKTLLSIISKGKGGGVSSLLTPPAIAVFFVANSQFSTLAGVAT